MGWVGHLDTQECHHPGRSALCKFTNNNPFFTCCKVVSNCFLLFITWKTNSEPFRHRRLFQSCFNLVLILLDISLSCGSAPNSSLACDSFTLEQYMHAHSHTHTHTHWHTTVDIYNAFNSWNILDERQTEELHGTHNWWSRSASKLVGGHSPNPAFLTDVVPGRWGLEFNLIKI